MNSRWIAAAAAAVAIGLFAVPMLTGRSARGNVAGTSVVSGGTCPAKSGGAAKLDFTVKDMNGAEVKIADYKGKVILLNYWATWCGPCKVEIPEFVDVYARYKDQGLVILGVSQDDDPETLRAFAKEWKMNYPVLVGRDHPDLIDAQGPVWGLPTSFFIARDGSICGKHMGPVSKEQLEREIKALL